MVSATPALMQISPAGPHVTCAEALEMVIVVDGFYSTGGRIVQEAAAKGFLGGSVLSNAIPHDGIDSFHADDYSILVQQYGNLSHTVLQLQTDIARVAHDQQRPVVVTGVIPGTDRGIAWTDTIAKIFGVLGNDPLTSANRYDKGAATVALQTAQQPTPEYLETADPAAAKAWAWDYWQRKSGWIVVRPAASNGGDGTVIARTRQQVADAVAAILNRPNQNAEVNQKVVLAEYRIGEQHAVDTVNFPFRDNEGHMRAVRIVTGIWHQIRDPSSGFPTNVYDHNILLPYHGKLQEQLLKTNNEGLDALGHFVGGGHVEQINGMIIDPNCRAAGGKLSVYEGLATGRNTLGMIIDAHTGKPAPILSPYELNTNVAVVYLRSHGKGGRMSRKRHEAWLKKLKEEGIVHEWEFNYDENEVLKQTKDSESMVGKIVLIGKNLADIHEMIAKIREMEQNLEFEK